MKKGTKIRVIEPEFKKMYNKVLQVWEFHIINGNEMILTWFRGNPYLLDSSTVEIVK